MMESNVRLPSISHILTQTPIENDATAAATVAEAAVQPRHQYSHHRAQYENSHRHMNQYTGYVPAIGYAGTPSGVSQPQPQPQSLQQPTQYRHQYLQQQQQQQALQQDGHQQQHHHHHHAHAFHHLFRHGVSAIHPYSPGQRVPVEYTLNPSGQFHNDYIATPLTHSGASSSTPMSPLTPKPPESLPTVSTVGASGSSLPFPLAMGTMAANTAGRKEGAAHIINHGSAVGGLAGRDIVAHTPDNNNDNSSRSSRSSRSSSSSSSSNENENENNNGNNNNNHNNSSNSSAGSTRAVCAAGRTTGVAGTELNAVEDHHCGAETAECTCSHHYKHQKKTQRQYHIPRPRNAFILFRQHWHQQLFPQERIKQSERGNGSFKTNSQVSVDIGQRWRSLSSEERQQWLDLAKKEKEEHTKKYPNYKYVPTRKEKKMIITGVSNRHVTHAVKSSCQVCSSK